MHLFLGDLQQNVVQYAAKWRAICRKTQCVLVLNARLNAANRKAFCIYTPCELYIYRFLFYMEERAGYGKEVLFACNLVAKCR